MRQVRRVAQAVQQVHLHPGLWVAVVREGRQVNTEAADEAVAWLRGQIFARRELAQAVASDVMQHALPGGVFPNEAHAVWAVRVNGDYDYTIGVHNGDGVRDAWADLTRFDIARFIVASDPQDTIARCDAELAILDLHQPVYVVTWDASGFERSSRDCSECDNSGKPGNWPCRTIVLLSNAYRHKLGHAEYWDPPGVKR